MVLLQSSLVGIVCLALAVIRFFAYDEKSYGGWTSRVDAVLFVVICYTLALAGIALPMEYILRADAALFSVEILVAIPAVLSWFAVVEVFVAAVRRDRPLTILAVSTLVASIAS